MKQQSGIWIDTKKAVIVHLKKDEHIVRVIHSGIEKRIRIPGEVKWFTRFANQYLNFEKKKENRRSNEILNYLKKVTNEIKSADELVLFGPAALKTELEKTIRNNTLHSPVIMSVETADSMTENQMVAWVKDYYQIKK